MSDAEPKSTSTMSQEPENANSQPSPVAVSEENLAALLRATLSSPEPETERLAEGTHQAAANESSAGVTEPHVDRAMAVTSPPAKVVESRLALFAAVKENRTAISRSKLTPETPLIDQPPGSNTTASVGGQFENLTASIPPKAAPLPVMVAEPTPLTPASAASIAIPPLTAIHQDESDKASRPRLVIGLVIGAVIATAGASTFLIRAHSSQPPRVAPAAPTQNVPAQVSVEPPLQVRVEPLGNGLIDVRWNPQSASIAQARDGRLVITEHNQQPRTLALEAEQLKTGHLTYQSAAESIQFDLEVVDRSGATAKESILALQAPASAPQTTRAPPQIQRGNTATPTAQNVANLGVIAQAPQLSQPAIRTFIAPAAQHNTEQHAFVDAPPVLTNGPVVPPEVGLPVPVAVILPPAKKDVAAPQQVQVESNIEAANLIKRVLPIYPPLARSTGIQGTVRFTAHIGKDGRIVNLKFTSGPLVLVESASAAVKQWVYRPTLLNGKPVDVITQIDVGFTLHQISH